MADYVPRVSCDPRVAAGTSNEHYEGRALGSTGGVTDARLATGAMNRNTWRALLAAVR